MLSSPSTKLVKYEADQLDVVRLSPPVRDRARHRHPEEYVVAPWLRTTYVEFNVSRPPFDDAQVRRALALAVDTETLANVILKGQALPASGGFAPPGMPGHAPDIGVPYQPEQARRLLAEAGYPDGRGLTAFESIMVTDVAPIGEYLREQWQEVLGIQIAWKELDWISYDQRWRTQLPHLGLPLGWIADIADPDSFLRVGLFQHDTPWRNPEYETVVQRARRSTEQVKRMELYRRAENILLAEVPIIPLVHPRLELLVKPWVTKFPASPIKMGFWKDVVIEPH